MTRRPTPSIIDAVLVADVAPDRTALRTRLRWDYSQVAPVDRRTVEEAAVDILANGQRLQQSAVAIGERLQSVKRLLPHGKFGEWCSTEFAMSQKTAENLMNVAREFGDKIETVSILTDSAMYMLAAPSTPPAARDQAIQEAQDTGKSPTKNRVREIIAQHKPGPVPAPIPAPTAREYSAAVQASQPAPARAYWAPAAAPIPAGWDDDDEAEYQAQLPTWKKAALEIPLTMSGRITRRRVAERLSLERLDNVRYTLQERRRELWREERQQERSPSAISNQQSPISNQPPATIDVLPPSDAPLPSWADEPASISKPGQSVADYLAYRDQAREDGMAAMNIREWREWLDEQAAAPRPSPLAPVDGRIPAARALIALYREAIATENQYGALTGQFSDWLAPKRELLTMIGHLEHLIAIIEHPEEAVSE